MKPLTLPDLRLCLESKEAMAALKTDLGDRLTAPLDGYTYGQLAALYVMAEAWFYSTCVGDEPDPATPAHDAWNADQREASDKRGVIENELTARKPSTPAELVFLARYVDAYETNMVNGSEETETPAVPVLVRAIEDITDTLTPPADSPAYEGLLYGLWLDEKGQLQAIPAQEEAA